MDPDSWLPLISQLPDTFEFSEQPDYLEDSLDTLESALHEPQIPQKKNLLAYAVPKLSEGGVCSLPVQMEEGEFSLEPFFEGLTTAELAPLYSVAAWLKEVTEADWAGVYGVYDGPHLSVMGEDHPPVLLKVAYDGKPSRPWFPLSSKFAERSNNVRAVLSENILLVDDVKAHLAGGGSYYECDPLVQSELCFPLVHQGKMVGLIDLEGLFKHQFKEKDIWLTGLAAQKLAPLLVNLPWQKRATGTQPKRIQRHAEVVESASELER